MRSDLDIGTIRAVLGSDDVQEKLEVLDVLDSNMHECDIFPCGILLSALADADSVVRERTLGLLKYCDYKFSDDEYLFVLRMIESADESVRQIAFEAIVTVFSGLPSHTLRQGLSYLWHSDAGVRETAAQLFTEFSFQITEDMYMKVAEAYGAANVHEREAILDFLQRNGHGYLVSD